MRPLSAPVAILALGLLMVQLGCGGGGPKELEDGRLFIQNDTSAPLKVTAYCNELGEVHIRVEVGEKKEVFGQVLPGGTKVTLHVESEGSPEAPYPAAREHPSYQDLEVTVDGNTTVRMYGPLRRAPHIDYEIRGE